MHFLDTADMSLLMRAHELRLRIKANANHFNQNFGTMFRGILALLFRDMVLVVVFADLKVDVD